jgi:hypothetical protein
LLIPIRVVHLRAHVHARTSALPHIPTAAQPLTLPLERSEPRVACVGLRPRRFTSFRPPPPPPPKSEASLSLPASSESLLLRARAFWLGLPRCAARPFW